LVEGKLIEPGPFLRGRGAQFVVDLEELVDLTHSEEERAALKHLSVYAAQRPHVRRESVVLLTHQYLRGTVPQRDHLECDVDDQRIETCHADKDDQCVGSTVPEWEIAIRCTSVVSFFGGCPRIRTRAKSASFSCAPSEGRERSMDLQGSPMCS